jgi:hypothetical protein
MARGVPPFEALWGSLGRYCAPAGGPKDLHCHSSGHRSRQWSDSGAIQYPSQSCSHLLGAVARTRVLTQLTAHTLYLSPNRMPSKAHSRPIEALAFPDRACGPSRFFERIAPCCAC